MRQKTIFMTGDWKYLIMSTYTVNKKILAPYLPQDTEIDLFNGKALLSIVAFTFSKVNFFGFRIPFHQNFGQINFRFYVKSKIDGTKGVVFIKEFAPKPIIALIANLFYNEPYYFKNIKVNSNKTRNNLEVTYKHNALELTANSTMETIHLKPNTLDHFVAERYIAFIKTRKRKTVQYKINHRPWKLLKLKDIQINNDFIKMLPSKFKDAIHIASTLVDGSSVTVEKGILQSL